MGVGMKVYLVAFLLYWGIAQYADFKAQTVAWGWFPLAETKECKP